MYTHKSGTWYPSKYHQEPFTKGQRTCPLTEDGVCLGKKCMAFETVTIRAIYVYDEMETTYTYTGLLFRNKHEHYKYHFCYVTDVITHRCKTFKIQELAGLTEGRREDFWANGVNSNIETNIMNIPRFKNEYRKSWVKDWSIMNSHDEARKMTLKFHHNHPEHNHKQAKFTVGCSLLATPNMHGIYFQDIKEG